MGGKGIDATWRIKDFLMDVVNFNFELCGLGWPGSEICDSRLHFGTQEGVTDIELFWNIVLL